MTRRPRTTVHALGAVTLAAVTVLAAAACGTAGTTASTAAPDGSRTGSGTAWTCPGPRTASADAPFEPLEPAPTPRLPTTAVDRSGTEVTVTDISRILALDTHGTLATTVHALGLGDRLVGRDVSTGVPELADLPVVTRNGHDLNAEAILALRPTVVLTDYTIGPLEVQLQLRDAGIPVVILDDTRTAATIAPEIRAVAQALGVSEAGDRLVRRTEADIAAARTRVERRRAALGDPAPRAVFLYLRGRSGTYDWFGRGTGADDLIDALGATDVATAAGVDGYRPLNAEALAAAAPEVVLAMTDGVASVGGVDGLVALPGLGETAAGATRCVVDMADTEILAFGTRFAPTIDALAAALYPDPEPDSSESSESPEPDPEPAA